MRAKYLLNLHEETRILSERARDGMRAAQQLEKVARADMFTDLTTQFCETVESHLRALRSSLRAAATLAEDTEQLTSIVKELHRSHEPERKKVA